MPATGAAKTLYRGISAQPEGRHVSAALGLFSTSRRDTALAYAGHGGELLEVYTRIQNPCYLRTEDMIALSTLEECRQLKARLIRQGHDGIFTLPIEGSGAHPGEISEYIAFDGTQVILKNCVDLTELLQVRRTGSSKPR